jgi:hypothetical protein
MADVRSGKVERVFVFKLDRLGRSLSHLALLRHELQRPAVPPIVSTQGSNCAKRPFTSSSFGPSKSPKTEETASVRANDRRELLLLLSVAAADPITPASTQSEPRLVRVPSATSGRRLPRC